MKRTFNTVFSIALKHSFYKIRECPDFKMLLSPETSALFGRFRVKMRPDSKSQATSFTVFQEGFEGGAPIVPIPDDTKFVFYLQPTNFLFRNFTDLPTGMEGKDVLYFNNRGGSDFLHADQVHASHTNNMEAIKLRRRIWQYEFTSGSDTAITLEVMQDSVVKKTVLLLGTNGNFQQGLDLSDLPKGRYEFAHKLTSGGTPRPALDFDVYLDEAAVQAGAMAVIEINKTAALSIDKKQYEIDFLMRKEYWKYFVVIKNDMTNTYAIEDTTGGGPSVTFNDVTGAIVTDSADDLTRKMLLAKNPGAVVKLFISSVELEYLETPLQNVSLRRNGGTVIQHLAAPPLSSPTAQTMICVVKPEELTLITPSS